MAPVFTLLLLFAPLAMALPPFTWGFLNDQDLDSSLTQCGSVTISLGAGDAPLSARTPPFTLFAYPQNGIPIQETLGSGSTFRWTVPFEQGTQLTIGISDNEGVPGGWVGVYTVAPSSTTSCLPSSSSSSSVKVKLNATSVNVCDSLGISVSGGTPPYLLNIFPFGTISADLNYTLPTADSFFSWVANTTASNRMMVGVRDSTNTFAASPPTVSITGNANDNQRCAQLSAAFPVDPNAVVSSSSSSPPSSGGGGSTRTSSSSSSGGAATNSSPPPVAGATGKSSNTGAIAGGAVGGLLGVAAVAGLAWYFLRRRQQDRRHSGSSFDDEKRFGGAYGDAIAGRGNFGSNSNRGSLALSSVVPIETVRVKPNAQRGSRPLSLVSSTDDATEETLAPTTPGGPGWGAAPLSWKPPPPPSLSRSSTVESVPHIGGLGGLQIANPDAARSSFGDSESMQSGLSPPGTGLPPGAGPVDWNARKRSPQDVRRSRGIHDEVGEDWSQGGGNRWYPQQLAAYKSRLAQLRSGG